MRLHPPFLCLVARQSLLMKSMVIQFQRMQLWLLPFRQCTDRPDRWPNPQGFDPERFLHIDLKEDYLYSYIPFGAGPRICLGKNFAIMEGSLILAMIAQKYRLDLLPDFELKHEPGIVSRPHTKLYMKVIRKIRHKISGKPEDFSTGNWKFITPNPSIRSSR